MFVSARGGASGIRCTTRPAGAAGIVWIGDGVGIAPDQGETGGSVARTRGSPVVSLIADGVAAAFKRRDVPFKSRERNKTPIVAYRRTLCTRGLFTLMPDNRYLATGNL